MNSLSISRRRQAQFSPSRVTRFLQLSVGSVVLIGGNIVSAQTDGSPCADGSSPCLVSSQGQNGIPAPASSFDSNGNPGNDGTAASAVSAVFGPQSSLTVRASNSVNSAITVQSLGGSGGRGGDASGGNSNPVPSENLDGGNGGFAASAGDASLTISQGANVQALMTGRADPIEGQPAAITVMSLGGIGGGGGVPSTGGTAGTSRSGSAAGNVSVQLSANPNQVDSVTGLTGAVVSFGTGVLAVSAGGSGGAGNDHISNFSKFGVDGADSKSAGGSVTVTNGTSISAFAQQRPNVMPSGDQGAGIWAVSAGGNGGAGGSSATLQAGGQGGSGGAGAAGGAVVVTNLAGGSIATQAGGGSSPMTPAIWAQSLGGVGGAGGTGGGVDSGGIAGAGANAGPVTVVNDGTLSTSGAAHSPGVLAQSFGGAGAGGGKGGGFGASGGEGATGGDGNTVTVSGSGSIQTSSKDSAGVLAQSVGGGGGNGGDSNGWMAVGGGGAAAGNGGAVLINSAQAIRTSGSSSAGIMAQSIGGGGGNGGNASGSGLGVNLVIGGTGGAGGNSSTVQAINTGEITTSGSHSSGIELQSIGGGGGKGGAAFGKDTSGVFGAQESVGGSGGNGGSSASVGYLNGLSNTNTGIIRTGGSDSFGIIAQSIGGGGGIGAASVAESSTYAPDDTPSLSLSAAIGGSGGAGGNGSSVQINNAGLIATTGAGSIGLLTQSIGGGGGAGGDASASSSARGSEVNIAASVALGGSGGPAGDGSWVTVGNSGLIVTTGESADGMLVQSIGGGGGNGGSGDSSAKSSGDATGITASVSIGGGSGSGGNANQPVTAINHGAILTLGDGAGGVVAQAIGGGGGRAGGAAGTANGDYSASVSVGGSGGNGGSAWNSQTPTTSVTVLNSGSIVTFGADAPAITAQSIGGGGGMGGKAGSNLGKSKKSTGDGGNGSAATDSTVDALATYFKSQGGNGGQYTNISTLSTLANQLLGNLVVGGVVRSLGDDPLSDANALDNLGSSQDDPSADDNPTNAPSIKANVSVGGSGGKGGSGGSVVVANTGSIGTVGSMSDGILAQSIGGGGGKGGAATSSGSATVNENQVNAPVAVGGSGGTSGVGSSVSVTNGDGTNPASIITIGALANGIVAQSIGGGGGIGGVAGGRNGLLQGINVSDKGLAIGGDSIGTTADANTVTAGAVTVTNSANASIVTRSHDANGIVAQSIGAGGGILKSLSTDTKDNNGGASNPDPYSANNTLAHEVSVTFGGSGSAGSNGSGGNVTVNNYGTITTAGRNAFGILAQSIGGGGGLVQGGEVAGGSKGFMNTGAMRGNGGNIDISTYAGSTIATNGAGAIAIFAQSVGGGGGLAGDTALSQEHLGFATAANKPGSGNGGAVAINVAAGSAVQSNGANAPAIVAQSVGGGGGYFTAGGHNASQGLYAGSSGGSGFGGTVNVTVSGKVSAAGKASPGIYAQSSQAGGASFGGSPILITINQGGTVSGGVDYYQGGDGTGAAIQVFEGMFSDQPSIPTNLIANNGTITSVNGIGGSAVVSYGNTTYVHNGGTGVINGNILLTAAGGNGWVQNDQGGQINSGPKLGVVTLRNDGTLDVGGKSTAGAVTEITPICRRRWYLPR